VKQFRRYNPTMLGINWTEPKIVAAVIAVIGAVVVAVIGVIGTCRSAPPSQPSESTVVHIEGMGDEGVVAGRDTHLRKSIGGDVIEAGRDVDASKRAHGDIITGGQVLVYKHGLDGSDAAKLVMPFFEHALQLQAQVTELSTEKEDLKKKLDAAIRRAEEAEIQGDRKAREALEQFRNSGDTAKLLNFLQADRDRALEDMIDRHWEIAAVAYMGVYMAGGLQAAITAIDDTLEFIPNDLGALTVKGHIYRKGGLLDDAEAIYNRVLEIARNQNDESAMAASYSNLGIVYRTRGDLKTAEDYYNKALEINEKLRRREGIAIQYGNLGSIYAMRGDLDRAEEYYNKALEIDERLGRQEGIAINYGNLGLVYAMRVNLDGAKEYLDKALEIDTQFFPGGDGMAINFGNIGLVDALRGDLQGAREHWTKARDMYEGMGMPHMVEKVQGWLDELPPE
jgi:tetratricopeptide (TPR) repeat protein